MEHMGVMDAGFLHMERTGIPLHVGSLMIFEGPAPTYEEYKDAMESRLFLVPRYRQKVRTVRRSWFTSLDPLPGW